MHKVTQTILHGQRPDVPGNCLQAAVASLMDMNLDDVPHFVTHADWLRSLTDWAREHGYAATFQPPHTIHRGLAYGPSERGIQHAVVWINGAMAWDPHPSRAGLLHVSDAMAWTPIGEPQPCSNSPATSWP